MLPTLLKDTVASSRPKATALCTTALKSSAIAAAFPTPVECARATASTSMTPALARRDRASPPPKLCALWSKPPVISAKAVGPSANAKPPLVDAVPPGPEAWAAAPMPIEPLLSNEATASKPAFACSTTPCETTAIAKVACDGADEADVAPARKMVEEPDVPPAMTATACASIVMLPLLAASATASPPTATPRMAIPLVTAAVAVAVPPPIAEASAPMEMSPPLLSPKATSSASRCGRGRRSAKTLIGAHSC